MEATYHQKAAMGKRVAALLLDGVFMNIILSLALFLLGWNIYVVLTSVSMLLYFGIFEGSGMHATLGKYILGLIVVDEDGTPITWSQSFRRALFRYVSGLALCIGYFVAFGDPQGRTWHDKMGPHLCGCTRGRLHTTPACQLHEYHRQRPTGGGVGTVCGAVVPCHGAGTADRPRSDHL